MDNTNETVASNGSVLNALRQAVPQYIDNLGANIDYIQKTKGKSTWLFGGSLIILIPTMIQDRMIT